MQLLYVDFEPTQIVPICLRISFGYLRCRILLLQAYGNTRPATRAGTGAPCGPTFLRVHASRADDTLVGGCIRSFQWYIRLVNITIVVVGLFTVFSFISISVGMELNR
jgi:hypothetical protein